jgi:predicted PhzF superfamily epimerase YddE/YHI9
VSPGLSASYHHVDVFAPRAYTGNSLAVFSESAGLTTLQMDRITKELRHFESIFLEPAEDGRTFHQGRFVGRPSEITIRARGRETTVHSVEVGGEVSLVGSGRLDQLPELSA